MHGQQRAQYKERFNDPHVVKALSQKAQQWHALNENCLQKRDEANGGKSVEDLTKTLALLDKMLRVNPDPLHLWNHRREILLAPQFGPFGTTQKEQECNLTANALERNPKAYGAWFHRKWTLREYLLSDEKHQELQKALDEELALTAQFLKLDERNFHCWNYRRFVVGCKLEVAVANTISLRLDGSWTLSDLFMGAQLTSPQQSEHLDENATTSEKDALLRSTILKAEKDFTGTKILQNFSNFSAFHYRSKLLLLALDDKEGCGSTWWWLGERDRQEDFFQSLVSEEWQLVENAIFTEPDDQTIWWYHRFLLDWVLDNLPSELSGWLISWLQTQQETLEMLLEDDECKWALLGLHLVCERLQSKQPSHENCIRMGEVLNQLLVLDPDRSERYLAMKKDLQAYPLDKSQDG